MANITVYEFDYYHAEQGIRVKGCGMLSEPAIKALREKDSEKDHQVITNSGIDVDESELTDGRYRPGATEEVKVTNPDPDSDTETDITAFLYEHICCTDAVMTCRRKPETKDNIVTITCPGCGFSFGFPMLSDEAILIERVTIDGEACDLPSKPVRIVPGNPG